jgi:signal transduction histidine kinase
MLIAGLSAFGWLYLKTKWTDTALREQTLFDQARVIAGYLKLDSNKSIVLNLPSRLAEAYSGANGMYRYAIRDADGQYLFDSGSAVAPLPNLFGNRRTLYDYDPDGPGPFRMFGAALRTEIGQRTVVVQVEQRVHDSAYLGIAVFDEFITDGGWLEIPFLLVLLGVSILIVNRALAPIAQISAVAKSIGSTSTNVRLPVDQVPLEIFPLVQSMNGALDRLEQGLQRQCEFNANAAHQLRTPLSVLMANVDALKEPELANLLRTDVEHMSRIVSQLLLVAQMETFSINLDENVDLNDAVAEIGGNLAPLALASGKSIELVHNDNPIIIRTNIFAIRAALGNLIENAIKHTPAGTSVRLRVTDRPSIEVLDCGPGIPLEQRKNIFERFWQGDRSSGGAGLGLAIVDQVMKTLQGSVSVGEAPDGGALFTLVFPQTVIVFEPIQFGSQAAE